MLLEFANETATPLAAHENVCGEAALACPGHDRPISLMFEPEVGTLVGVVELFVTADVVAGVVAPIVSCWFALPA